MTPLNLPDFQVKLSGTQEKPVIFDLLRRKFVALTPEEWVRQHFIHFLIEHRGYPASLMQNEIQLKVGNKVLRADSVLYGSNLHPRMIIEYKAPAITITQKSSTRFQLITCSSMSIILLFQTASTTMSAKWIIPGRVIYSLKIFPVIMNFN